MAAIIKCDNCSKELREHQNLFWTITYSTRVKILDGGFKNDQPYHFCSDQCLRQYVLAHIPEGQPANA